MTPEEERQADYYKGFRSAVVLVWVFCNFALAAVVTSAAGLEQFSGGDDESTSNQRATIYMAVILWSVAGISIFKFCGAMWYLVVRMVDSPSPSQRQIHTDESTVPRRLIPIFCYRCIFHAIRFIPLYDNDTPRPYHCGFSDGMTWHDEFMIGGPFFTWFDVVHPALES